MATTSIRWQLSMGQMMKLVVFGAATSLVLVPMAELVELGVATWVSVLVFGAVAVPLTWAIVSRLLLRPGVFKEWFFMAMLLASVAACLVVLNYFLITIYVPLLLRLRLGGTLGGNMGWEMALLFAIDLQLALGLVFLLRRVVPGRCPACRCRSLLPHGHAPRNPGERRRRLRAHCLRCETDFSRRPATWEPIALREAIASH